VTSLTGGVSLDPIVQTGLAPARDVREASSKYPRLGRRRFPIQSDRRRRWPYRSLPKVGDVGYGVYAETSWPYDATRWAMWKEAVLIGWFADPFPTGNR